MNEFVQKLLDDIHNINPELSLKRQTEYNQNFVNNELNKQCDIHGVSNSLDLVELEKKIDEALDNETSESLKEWLHSKIL